MRERRRKRPHHQIGRRRIAIGVGEARFREVDRLIVALPRQPIDDRAARIAKAEQLRDFVIGLAGRVIARPADQLVHAGLRHEIQAGVSAGDDEHGRRKLDRAVLQKNRLDVPGQVVDRNDRLSKRHCRGLGERHADQERSDQSGALRHRDSVNPGTTAHRHRPARARRRRRCRGRAGGTRSRARRRPIRDGSPTCEAMTLDRAIQGRGESSVVETTAAAVSSHEVSMPRTFMSSECRLGPRHKALGPGKPEPSAWTSALGLAGLGPRAWGRQ